MKITYNHGGKENIVDIIKKVYSDDKLLLLIKNGNNVQELTVNVDILMMTNEFVVNSNVDKHLIEQLHREGYIIKTNRYAITGYSICPVVKMTDKFLQDLESTVYKGLHRVGI